MPLIQAKIAQECEDTAELAGQLERGMIAELAKDYKQLDPRDQAGALRNVSTTKGINIDKAALMRGQPTEIVEHRHDVGELWSEFAAMFPSVVEGEATEITDVEVVPGADLEPGPEPISNRATRLRHEKPRRSGVSFAKRTTGFEPATFGLGSRRISATDSA